MTTLHGIPPFGKRQHGLVSGQRGLMLLALLIVLLFSSVLALAAAEVWATARQREREAELLFVGQQYRQALRQYYFAAPNAASRTLPASLADLLEDKRYPLPVRHLRRLYADPVTGGTDWGLVKRGDLIVGVHSLSDAKPLKQTGFNRLDQAFEGRPSYREWAFLFVPPASNRN
jgi:type II secretory pathway pseudopilin PulG